MLKQRNGGLEAVQSFNYFFIAMAPNPCFETVSENFLHRFLRDVKELQDEKNNINSSKKEKDQCWIHRSYPHFIRFFRDKNILDEHDVIIGRFFTYGWMPRILLDLGDVSKESEDDLVKYLNEAKNHDKPSLESRKFEHIARCMNNSVVGASKLLHFINPHVYAIIDTKVCEYLQYRSQYLNDEMYNIFSKKIIFGRHNIESNVEAYQKYISLNFELCQKLLENHKFISYKKKFCTRIFKKCKVERYQITPVRFIEYVMYLYVKKGNDIQ